MNATSSSASEKSPIVAILGCGKFVEGKVGWAIGHNHALGWLTAFPQARLHAVDPSAENLRAFGERFQVPLENLFARADDLYAALTPEYVSVCTWPALHAPQVIEAANRGVKGIACEKPLALDGQEIAEMVAACEKSGTHLVVGHQRVHCPVFELAWDLVAEGKLGDGLVMEARVQDGWDVLSWTTHWFDMASFIFGAEPESVLAGVDFTGARIYQHAVENSSAVFVQFRGGAQGIFISGPPSADGYSIHIRGSRGHLRILGDTLKLFTEEGFSSFSRPDTVSGGFRELMASLVDAVENQTTPRCDISRARFGTEIAFAAHESARTQRAVSLPATARFAPLEVLAHPARPLPLSLKGKVVLLADDHFGSRGRHGLAAALRDITGSEVTDLEAAAGLRDSDLADAGLVVIYHTHGEASPETRQALTAWVKAGRPLLLVHCAVGAWPAWEEYLQWCGRVWAWGRSEHPYEPSSLIPAEGSSFPWAEAWLPKDEIFTLLEKHGEVVDHCSVRMSTGEHPAAWTSREQPNIAAWIPGHREDIYLLAAQREGLRTMLGKILPQS